MALILTSLGARAQSPKAAPPAARPSVKTWEDLVPADWNPMALFQNKPLAGIAEGSVGEVEMMREMRKVWDAAPVRQELAGIRIRLPGYVVPLEHTEGKVSEFLLVPYFGACVHTPPPPANQIIHVRLDKPLAKKTMDTVWVSGPLSIQRNDSQWGVSGYLMNAPLVEPYVEDKR
jgi:hypothetical protein